MKQKIIQRKKNIQKWAYSKNNAYIILYITNNVFTKKKQSNNVLF